MCCLIQASPHSLLIVFRNPAGDFLDLVKYDSETAGSQACRRCELRAAVSVFTGGKITMYYIGVDLGTSAVKLLLMEGSGKICNIVSKEYPLFFPHPGWSEQNPEDWFAQSMEGIKELTEGIDRKEVAGIGFGGQMHGLVTLDKDDNVIRPAILWNDGRTGE